MVLEGLNGTLSWVGMMVSGGGKLVHKFFDFNVGNEFFEDLVVQAKKLVAESAFLQVVMTIFEPLEEYRRGSIFDGNIVYEIDISIKHDKQTPIASERCD